MKIIRKIRTVIKDHRQNKYISYKEAILNWYNTRNLDHKIYNLSGVKKFKTSDTIFVLGNGPSLNILNDETMKVISNYDSFGISYSFLKDELVPTFFMFPLERDIYSRTFFKDKFSRYRETYKDVVIFFHDKMLFRMAHPRLTPYFFPEEAKSCFFWLPESIRLERKRAFNDNDFDKTLNYRGTLSLVLDLILKLDYRNIVLLGVDLDRWEYFYQNMEGMTGYIERMYEEAYGVNKVKEKNKKYVPMYPKPGKFQPLDEYLYALKDYLKRNKDVNLFVGFKDNMLCPKIPAYFD